MASCTSDGEHHLANVRSYYDRANPSYLEHMGTTFQACMFRQETSLDRNNQSNLWFAERAGIKAHQIVLDAGCGVCGPAMDIARHFNIVVNAITISSVQARTAKKLIQENNLDDQVRVIIADYHCLPFPANSFDVVYFFESASHSNNLIQLFTNVFRVLRPGGLLYVKDVYLRDQNLSELERRAITEASKAYALNPTTIEKTQEFIDRAGFDILSSQDLTNLISTDHWARAQVDRSGDKPVLTSLGKIHYRPTMGTDVPIYYGDMLATKPLLVQK